MFSVNSVDDTKSTQNDSIDGWSIPRYSSKFIAREPYLEEIRLAQSILQTGINIFNRVSKLTCSDARFSYWNTEFDAWTSTVQIYLLRIGADIHISCGEFFELNIYILTLVHGNNKMDDI